MTSTAARGRIHPGDVIVAANDRTDLPTESEFLAYLRLSQPPLKNVHLKLLRKGEAREVDLSLEPAK